MKEMDANTEKYGQMGIKRLMHKMKIWWLNQNASTNHSPHEGTVIQGFHDIFVVSLLIKPLNNQSNAQWNEMS